MVVERLVGESLDAGCKLSRSTWGQSMPPCGGCGSYSIASWIMRATSSLGQDGREPQSGIDPGRHPGAGQISAVLDPALGHVGCAQAVKAVMASGWSPDGLQQARTGEKQ